MINLLAFLLIAIPLAICMKLSWELYKEVKRYEMDVKTVVEGK